MRILIVCLLGLWTAGCGDSTDPENENKTGCGEPHADSNTEKGSGCGEPAADEPAVDPDGNKTFSKHGVTFRYPSDWKITPELDTGIVSIDVEPPGEAYLWIFVAPVDADESLGDFAKSMIEHTARAFPKNMTVTQSKVVSMKPRHGFERLSADFTVTTGDLSDPHVRVFGSRRVGDRDLRCVTQVSKEDEAKVREGFELILSSLRLDKP